MYSDDPKSGKTLSPQNPASTSHPLEEEEIIETRPFAVSEWKKKSSEEIEAKTEDFIKIFKQQLELERLKGSKRMTDNSNNDPGARDGERSPASVESKDANVLVDSFKVKLIESASPLEGEMLNGSSSTSFFGKECCIYRVEEKFHELSHRAYIPDMVSIGPFHRGKGNLPAMEQYKLFNLRNLLTRMTTTTTEWSSILEEWVESMKCIEEEARKFYSEPINLSSNEFVKMMLVDGLFIIELFRKKAGEVQIDRDDPLFDNTTCNMSNLVHDLVLLENQLPMLVLNHLFNLPTLHNELCDSSTVTTLALIFFDLLVPRDKKVLNTDYEGKHLLDLLHKTFLNALPRPLETQNSSWKSIPSATELKRAGVKFKKGTTEGNFLDIKFTDGVLEIPPIIIQDQTATLLRNLIAFEQCSGRYDTYMTSYATLMKRIIKSTSDVGFLRNQGIITNYLGDDEDFSNIFIELSCGVNTLGNFYYSELCDQVNTHCEKTLWHVWGATQKRDFSENLWKYVTGLVVLVFALIMGRFFNSSISRKGFFITACVLSGLAVVIFALMASRMTNKVWSLIRTGENTVIRESQCGDGQYSDQGSSEAILSNHSEDSTVIEVVSLGYNKLTRKPLLYGSQCSIFRVHERFRKINKYAYTPKMISIGPFHRGEISLREMKDLKLHYVRALLSRTATIEPKLEQYFESIRKIEQEARRCYSEPIEMNSNEFIEMMVVDGLFVIELFRKSFGEVESERDHPIISNRRVLSIFAQDLMLLENQIPMLVLKCLFNLSALKEELQGSPSFNMLALCFFNPLMPREKEVLKTHVNCQGKHLLDLLGKTFHNLPLSEKSKHNSFKYIPCVTELQRAGVKFKKGSAKNSFLDIKFSDGVLEIPPVTFQDQTDSLLSNLIAYEQHCDGHVSYISSYALLMYCLIKSAKEVGFLRNQGIITNYLGDDEDVSVLFNKLCSEVTRANFYYAELCDEVNKYYKTTWHKWRATLKRDYFNNPWATLSVIAAGLLLLLTLTTTIFASLS